MENKQQEQLFYFDRNSYLDSGQNSAEFGRNNSIRSQGQAYTVDYSQSYQR